MGVIESYEDDQHYDYYDNWWQDHECALDGLNSLLTLFAYGRYWHTSGSDEAFRTPMHNANPTITSKVPRMDVLLALP